MNNPNQQAPGSSGQATPLSGWHAWLVEKGPKLLLFARQQTRSGADAEDVLQEALVKLVGKIESGEFVGGEESWMPYLYTAIRRLSIDVGRRDDRRRRREESVVEDASAIAQGADHPWFDSDGSDDETREMVEAGLRELPPKFAEVIIMKIWNDKTFAEIGEALEISQNTAASRYRYGLEALRKKLGSARRKGDL
jgi:RNA polymerase sigma-70 factor (ECF subfamily)